MRGWTGAVAGVVILSVMAVATEAAMPLETVAPVQAIRSPATRPMNESRWFDLPRTTTTATTKPQHASVAGTTTREFFSATRPVMENPEKTPSTATSKASVVSSTFPTTRPFALPSFSEPAISPDGKEIAFVSGGDIWTVSASGGEASLLVSHPATESRPRYSPDGKQLAFVSTRTGNGDIYVLNFDSGEIRRVTYDDGHEELDSWSRDGKWLYFSTTAHDPGAMPQIYRVGADGGTPMPVVADKYTPQYAATLSPNGDRLLFCAGGNGERDWARVGHDHSDETDIWLMIEPPPGATLPVFTRVTEPGDKNLWPLWAGNGRSFFYVSDRGGAQNIWQRSASNRARSAPKQLTLFKDGRVLFPDLTPDGRTMVFERNFGIWKLDTSSGETREVSIHLRGAPATPNAERLNFGNNVSELAVSPDSRKMAFISHGQVFAVSAHDGGDAVRVTHTRGIESHVIWSHDSKRLVYVSDRDGPRHLFLYDFSQDREYRLTRGLGDDTCPGFGPDDRLAFERDGTSLLLIDIYTRRETVLATGQSFDRPPFDRSQSPFAWSPTGNWIAFISRGPKGFDNVYCVPTAAMGSSVVSGSWPFGNNERTTPPRQVTFMANAGSNAVYWSPDGTFLMFGTGQRTEEYQMAKVDLVPRTPHFRDDTFRELFREIPRSTSPGRRFGPVVPEPVMPLPATLPSTAPSVASQPATQDSGTRIVFDNIRQRLTLLPINADSSLAGISPDGKNVLYLGLSSGQENLYVYSLDDGVRDPVPRQLTSTSGSKRSVRFSSDGKDVYYIDGGRINVVSLDSRFSRTISVTADLEINFASEKFTVFHQAWQYLNDNFFDPRFNGVDWNAIHQLYLPRVAGARTSDELRRILSMMVGELNCSHVGAYNQSGSRYAVARLGLFFDRRQYEEQSRLVVAEVVPLGPAAIAGITPGDVIAGVERFRISNHANLEALLEHKIGKRVRLLVTDPNGRNAHELSVLAIDYNTERTLLYRAWVESRRQYVDRISGGRLGYIHIPDMTETALARLNSDLDSENQTRDGIVIDIRNNRGGFVNGFAIDVFARRNYLTMTRRGYAPVPSRALLGQRAIGVPSVLVTNRFTISDAEDFTEGFRFLKLGKVVGEPTSGAVIFTSNVPLIDGTTFRIPETLVTANDGTPLEMHPRPVDVEVVRPVGETGDSQLDAAVAELLRTLPSKSEK